MHTRFCAVRALSDISASIFPVFVASIEHHGPRDEHGQRQPQQNACNTEDRGKQPGQYSGFFGLDLIDAVFGDDTLVFNWPFFYPGQYTFRLPPAGDCLFTGGLKKSSGV